MAIDVSEAFKNAMKAPVKVVRASIATDDGQEFSSSDDLINLTIESSGYYFGSTTKTLSFNLLGTDHNLIGKDIHLTISVQTDSINDSWEDCDLGNYYVYEQNAKLEKETTEFKAYDRVGTLAYSSYSSGGFTFPCTISGMVEQLANNFNLNYDATQILVNGDKIISDDLYEKISNITYRDILSEIAGATATIAMISGANDTLLLKNTINTPSELWTYDNLKSIKFEPKYGEINAVVLSRKPQEDNIVVRDEESIAENGLTELKLTNNELLDDDRGSMAQPILDSVDGFWFFPFECTTEGHCWHECGDRIEVINGEDSWQIIISYIKISIDGGIKETIKGVRPINNNTDYSLAGGIMKTIYNTEIKVDKQNQQIKSIVEEQTILENQVNDNYTTITQSISNVVTSVQNSGGNNLIRNSAMYSLDDNGQPLSWDILGSGDLVITPSAEAAVNGSLSRQNITLRDLTVAQTIEVKADNSGISDKTYYSFSCKIKKTAVGECLVRISDGTESGVWDIFLDNGDESFYEEYSIEGILPNSSNLTVSIYGSGDSEFSITDMMLAVGNYKSQWTQANGEFANTQVSIDNNGVTIRSSTLAGTYTKQTPQELSTYSSNRLMATINDDGILAPKIETQNEISMPPIKIVPQPDGWAFVKEEG